MLAIRYCRRCRARTDHIDEPIRFSAWNWALFWPLVWIVDLVVNRPLCLLCLEREDQGEDGD